MIELKEGTADPFFNVNTQHELVAAECIHAELWPAIVTLDAACVASLGPVEEADSVLRRACPMGRIALRTAPALSAF